MRAAGSLLSQVANSREDAERRSTFPGSAERCVRSTQDLVSRLPVDLTRDPIWAVVE